MAQIFKIYLLQLVFCFNTICKFLSEKGKKIVNFSLNDKS